MRSSPARFWIAFLWAMTAICFMSRQVGAVPSYARQANTACSSCHTVFPGLNSFGRLFKLNGYTLTGIKTIESKGENEETRLKLLEFLPLSGMLQTSLTRLDRREPGKENNIAEFPQQLSVFFAGPVTPLLGTFIQVTYDDQSAAFAWDNADIRFAKHTALASTDLIYGITLNNNPTVQDVWNTTPAWGFPFSASAVAPTPASSAFIDGALAQEVVGLGLYGLWNNLVYLELTGYRSTPEGGVYPPDSASTNTIKGIAPYWRAAVQHQWSDQYLEIGTYGLYTRIYPSGIAGLTDGYTDTGLDGQYERDIGSGSFTAHATYIHEKQDLDASFPGNNPYASNTLNSFKVDGIYSSPQGIGLSLGFFTVSGNSNRAIYSPQPISGSRTGTPNSNGIIGEVDYLPWLNTRFSAQYVVYTEFNGAKTNYDGTRRNASDNNTLYISAWLMF
jgi:hypothetical protein